MLIIKEFPLIDFIQLFGEGGDGGTGGGDAGAGPAGAEAAAPAQPRRTGEKNPLAGVQYGKQETPDAGEPAQVSATDRSAKFEELIRGEYKDLYEAKLKDTMSKRLKGTEEKVTKYDKLTDVIELLSGKYGVKPGDIDALSQAITDDETFYENEALEKGMTVQQVKELKKMERENAQLRAQMEEQQTHEEAERIYASWMQQAEEVKTIYPGFDLAEELQDEQFQQLVRSNVPIQTAFEVLHKDEIIPAAMQYTAKQVEGKLANKIRAGQNRPAEGAMRSQNAVVTKSDVSQLTKADRQEIARRVARGERIVF